MNIIMVDDERFALEDLTEIVPKLLPDANCKAFNKAKDAMVYAQKNQIDIAFLDINMRILNGITMAQKLIEMYPKVNIIFCTGYPEYSLDAHNLFCSAYLLKPITEEKIRTALDNLRYPVEEKKKILYVQCFGMFEIFVGHKPITFKYSKTKELFAYLIDKLGADCKTREIMAEIFEDDDKMSYFQNLRRDLLETFDEIGFSHVIREGWGVLGINKDKIKCDYYEYLNGKKELNNDEYMPQYNFAETTRARLYFENE